MPMNSIDVVDELSQNFIDFAYEANVNRAFFDARDGLKLGQRCCIWDMYINGCRSDKPHVKSAKVAGSVCGRFHPHGDQAIYETFVRMTQDWINNNPEVEGHGGFGNQIIGPEASSSRYTEVRLSKITEDGMLSNIDKDVVDMVPNYIEDEHMPSVLPAVFPRLFVNGGSGIGVSIANTFLPHNLVETTQLIINYINTGVVDNKRYIPDFPSGGVIVDLSEIEKINKTGKGKVVLEACGKIGKNEIRFTEFCYQTYIEPLIEQIKAKIEDGTISGIKSVTNKSDRTGLCLSIEVSKNYDPKAILSQLYKYTDLRQTYNANQIAIVGKTPKLLSLSDMLDIYTRHNVECIRREFEFDYNKTKDRIEILDGLLICAENIDQVVAIIKSSRNSTDASVKLQSSFDLTERQAKAILDMRLAKLNSIELADLMKEKQSLVKYLIKCDKVRSNEREQKKILVKRLTDLATKFGSPRKTKVHQKKIEKEVANPVSNVIVGIDSDGYIKFSSHKSDHGSRYIDTDTDAMLYLFSNKGKMYRVSVKDDVTDGKGTALGSILKLDRDEYIVFMTDGCPAIAVTTTDMMGKIVSFDELKGDTRNLRGMVYIKLNDNSEVMYVGSIEHCSPQLREMKQMGKSAKGVKISVDLSKNK